MKYQAINVPEWLRKNAIYQINPRTFTEEGTINSITKELPFLKELGFDIIYLCPVFEADVSEDITHWSERQKKYKTGNPKNPYRMNNYFEIDSEYGTMEDLRELVETCHEMGMKVLLDLVYLHIGPEAPIIKRHPEFAKMDEDGKPICNEWHFTTLDFNCPGLREYLWSNMVYYVSELDVDGFRCDVGDGVPNDFWAEGRRRMQTIKADAVLINEGSDMSRLANTFDASYCFEWEHDTYKVFAGENNLDGLRKLYDRIAETVPTGGLVLRALDNHDTVTDWPERSEVLMGHDGMEMVQVMNYIIDGIPMVYCGNELADTAKINMFANRFFMGEYEVTDRSLKITPESLRRQGIYKKLNAMLKECDIITRGKTAWVENSEPDQVLSFVREYEGAKVFFAGNFGTEEITVNFGAELTDAKTVMSNLCTMTDNSVTLGARGYLVVRID